MTPWSKRLFIIAEAGVNHNGDVDLAHRLIDAAAAAKADAVKFQTFRADALVSRAARMAEYQKANTGKEESQYDMLKRLELSHEDYRALQAHARAKGIVFFSTAFDFGSIDFLGTLDMPVWKIPSGEITNYPYLVRVAAQNKPVILSTGMATISEVGDAVDVLLANGLARENICILHCNTDYPTLWEDVNLRAMLNLGAAFGTAYGYSDHTQGIEIPIASAALGAKVLEKHFTLDRALLGPDHKASLTPDELERMVQAVRAIEVSLGDGVKRPTHSETGNREIARKSIVSARAIKAGEVYTEENLAVKRPGTGISPMQWPQVLGRKAPRDFAADENISW